jgi:signal transduction histidine kinase
MATATTEPAGIAVGSPESEHDLLSSVCHDLKEPLASILMGTSFLRTMLAEGEGAPQRIVETIHRAATRMNQRISTFSDLARLGAHDLRLVISTYDGAAILQLALEELLQHASARRVSAEIELARDARPLPLPCDRDRLLQIFRHLCACALHLAPEGARIVMSASEGAGSVAFEVAVHRPPDSRRVVAELPKSDLAIARGLIELHGGQLAIRRDPDSLVISFTLGGAPLKSEPAPRPAGRRGRTACAEHGTPPAARPSRRKR